MRIRIKASRRRPDKITLQMASMIDAVFLLLAYFLVTTAMTKPEDRLSPLLQTQSKEAGQVTDFQPQKIDVLMIDGAPSYRLGGQLLRDRDELRRTLDDLPVEAGVFIVVHDDVLVSFAVAAIQVARDCGFEKVTYVPAK